MASDKYKYWPIVPVDPSCIPNGYEPVYVGHSKANELTVSEYGDIMSWPEDTDENAIPDLIIRPISNPKNFL